MVEVVLKEMKIKINDKEISLSIDDARELFNQLKKCFSEEENYVFRQYKYCPYVPPNPTYPQQYGLPYPQPYMPDGTHKIYC